MTIKQFPHNKNKRGKAVFDRTPHYRVVHSPALKIRKP